MSLFRRRKGRDRPEKTRIEPPRPAERTAPTLGAAAGGPRWDAMRDKVQAEVCAVLARTVLELIQSSQAHIPAMEELVCRQAINRLYADVLYDFLAAGEDPAFDPAERVLGWAREAMDRWGVDQARQDAGMASSKAALSQSILAALEAAARDQTLRKAALERLKAAAKAPDGPAAG
jgi:hypothetical protein